MSKKRPPNAFDGVKVFAATMIGQRQTLGETVSAWLETARRDRPGFQLVDVVVRQSSDTAFHCVSICLFFKYDSTPAKEKPRG